MESSHSSSSSLSASSSSPSSSPPRCKRLKRTAYSDISSVPMKDVVAALHHGLALQPEPDGLLLLLAHLRGLVSLLCSPLTSASPAQALCDAGFLELLPQLLTHSSSKVGKKSAEAVGLLAVASYEVSCHLAAKPEVLGALAQLLQRSKCCDVLLSAIHSILNVATSEVGCAALREVVGLPQQLLRLVSFLADTLTEDLVKAGDMETFGKSHGYIGTRRSMKECALSDASNPGGHQMPKEAAFNFLLNVPLDETAGLFDLALVTVNSILNQDCDDLITRSGVLLSLQRLWQRTIQLQSQFDDVRLDNVEVGPSAGWCMQLAKLIVRMAMVETVDVDSSAFDARGLLGKDVEHFFQKHWESSPARMTTALSTLGLSNFMEKIAGHDPARLLELLVDGMVACPPAVADELDPELLYKDLKQGLGRLPVFNQDIRLLKCTDGDEMPYPLGRETSFVTYRDCVKAYASGNTVVIRGLQFRYPEVSGICKGLAAELGQVTVGANLYLTPPGAQGLGVHFDDHCVFVCQLRGHKRWSVHPPLEPLPRLYSFKALSTKVEQLYATSHCDLQEGDLLYIPRGFLHEARTGTSEEADVNAPTAGFAACSECPRDASPIYRTSFTEWHGASLHLSFGVEVEPAFEWEGLLHIALRLWSQRTIQQHDTAASPINSHKFCEILLHVAIRNTATSSQLFRKACMLRIYTCQNTQSNADAERTFRFLLDEVRDSADSCHAAVECYRREGGVAWLDWLRHVSVGGFAAELCVPECCISTGLAREALDSAFRNVRKRFCQEASFLEAVAAQDALLCSFRSSRQKLMNGLLALHAGCSSQGIV